MGFDRLLPHAEHDLRLPDTPKGTIFARKDSNPGDVGENHDQDFVGLMGKDNPSVGVSFPRKYRPSG